MHVKVLLDQFFFETNKVITVDMSKYSKGMLFLLFNAGATTKQTNILYSFSRSSNKQASLVEMINKNHPEDGYKIESAVLKQDTFEIKTGKYGGAVTVIYIGI